MSFWDRIRAMLTREKRELDKVVADTDLALDRRERELSATPEERLVIEQRRAEEVDATFDELKRKIERGGA